MADIVPTDIIEHVVGVPRHRTDHIARALSAEQTVYILHSQGCRAEIPDPRDCPWTHALDRGIDINEWTEDVPLVVRVRAGRLVPRRQVKSCD